MNDQPTSTQPDDKVDEPETTTVTETEDTPDNTDTPTLEQEEPNSPVGDAEGDTTSASSSDSTGSGPADTPTATKVASIDDITSDQIDILKKEAIEYAKAYAKTGISSRKEPSPSLANDQGPYYWWEKQATFESNTWSVSLWEYDNENWQLQATKVELQQDGRSRMIAYSMRKDTDPNFPGFQVYKEQSDDRYHPAAIEDVVYLNRVLKGLKDTA